MKRFKRSIPVLVAICAAATSVNAEVGVNLNINLGVPAVRVAAPAPVVVIEEPPEFIMPSPLGFYVAVGVPYDLFYISNTYYVFRGGSWYCAPRYSGPWKTVQYKRLPPGLRKHKVERIRVIRDDEHRHYRGRKFRPAKEWKEERKREKEEWKEERKRDKHEWKGEHGRGKHGRDD